MSISRPSLTRFDLIFVVETFQPKNVMKDCKHIIITHSSRNRQKSVLMLIYLQNIFHMLAGFSNLTKEAEQKIFDYYSRKIEMLNLKK